MRYLIVISLCLGALPAAAQDETPQECAPTDSPDKYRMLRRLSLDLRGRIPTVEEYEALSGLTELGPEVVEAMLTSEDYFAVVRHYHRKLLWSSVENNDILDPGRLLRTEGRPTERTAIYWVPSLRPSTYRGSPRTMCVDRRQPANAYDADGVPQPIQGSREGWVEVNPYWDRSSTIRVCAFDAQTRTRYQGRDCSKNQRSKGCGCGPGLRWCVPVAIKRAIDTAMGEEPGRLAETIVREGRSYFDILRTRETMVNGPLLHYYRNLATADDETTRAVAVDTRMGDLDIQIGASNESRWEKIDRQGQHSGVLTTASYLMRFASHRSRANRFRTAFRCEPFVPSEDGLPADAADEDEPNLRVRTGCSDCHQQLDVLSAHWGRFRSDGQWGVLPVDPLVRNQTCGQCTDEGPNRCSDFCNTYFVTPQNAHRTTYDRYWGMPLARAYLNRTETEVFDEGPRGLSNDPSEQAAIASCTVRTLAAEMLGRELTDAELSQWIPGLNAAFAESGYQFTELVRAVVSSEQYRVVR